MGSDMTEDDDKKAILSSDEKGAAKSTLGGAVAGAVVGTAVGTPVVGTLIGAVSGAVMAARKRRAKSQPTKRGTKAKTSPAKKRAPAKAAAKKSIDAKAKGGDKIRKELNTKGESRSRKKPALRLGESAQSRSHHGKHAADVLATAGVVTVLIGNDAVYTMLGRRQRLVLVHVNHFASTEDRQIRGARVNPNAPSRRRAPNL